MVVVMSILVVNTVVQKGPLVFLSQTQKLTGEIDAIISTAKGGIYTADDYAYYGHHTSSNVSRVTLCNLFRIKTSSLSTTHKFCS